MPREPISLCNAINLESSFRVLFYRATIGRENGHWDFTNCVSARRVTDSVRNHRIKVAWTHSIGGKNIDVCATNRLAGLIDGTAANSRRLWLQKTLLPGRRPCLGNCRRRRDEDGDHERAQKRSHLQA